MFGLILLDQIFGNAKQKELCLEAALARKRPEGEIDISLIIPCTSRNEADATALYFTVISALNDLQNSGIKFEIIVVVDGDHEIPDRTILLRDCGLVDSMLQTKHGSPQGARQSGALRAKGAVLVFADGHCSFPSGCFRTLLDDMKEAGADLMHAPFRALNRIYYHYRVGWDSILWNAEHVFEPASPAPYRVAIANHGCFAVRRDSFLRVGGYWQALKGFGGEETQLNLKMWMAGHSCWVTPRAWYWHQFHHVKPESGKNIVHADSPFVRNFLMIAAAYADDRAQVVKARDAFMEWTRTIIGNDDLIDEILADDAVREERRWITENAKYKSISEVRSMFEEEGVAN